MAMNMACKLVLSYWNKFPGAHPPSIQHTREPQIPRRLKGIKALMAYWQRLPAPLFQLGVLKQPLLEVGP